MGLLPGEASKRRRPFHYLEDLRLAVQTSVGERAYSRREGLAMRTWIGNFVTGWSCHSFAGFGLADSALISLLPIKGLLPGEASASEELPAISKLRLALQTSVGERDTPIGRAWSCGP